MSIEIHTSYFAKAGQLPRHIVPIAICLKPPHWFKCLNYAPLAPTRAIFQLPPSDYTVAFGEHLANLNARAVAQDLARLSIGNDVALCCFEKPTDFCHRHLVAAWLSEQLGISVREYVYPAPQIPSNDLTLF